MHLFENLILRLPTKISGPLGPVGEKLDLAFFGQGPRSRAARAALLTFAIRVFAAVLAYAAQVVLARMMGAHDYGIYAIVWVWVLVISAFASLGYSTGLLRFIPELYKAERFGELRTVILRGPLVNIGLSTLAVTVGIAVLIAFPNLFSNEFLLPMILAAFCIPMIVVGDNQDGVAQAFDWTTLRLVPSFIVRPLLILAIFIGMAWAGVEASASTAMIAALSAVWIVTLGQLLILAPRVREKIGRGPREGQARPWVKAALPMLVVEGFFFLIINTDVMVAGLFVPPEQVAVYYAAAKTLALVHFVAFAIRVATSHKIAEYHATNDRAALERTLSDTLHWTFWPSLAIAAFLMLEGQFILSLFGDGFEDGMAFLTILLVGVVIRASVGPAEAMLTMANRQTTSAWVYGVVFAVNLSLNLILIPTIGLLGAAIATAISMVVEAVLLLMMVRRHLGVISFIGVTGRLNRSPKAQGLPEPAE